MDFVWLIYITKYSINTNNFQNYISLYPLFTLQNILLILIFPSYSILSNNIYITKYSINTLLPYIITETG